MIRVTHGKSSHAEVASGALSGAGLHNNLQRSTYRPRRTMQMLFLNVPVTTDTQTASNAATEDCKPVSVTGIACIQTSEVTQSPFEGWSIECVPGI